MVEQKVFSMFMATLLSTASPLPLHNTPYTTECSRRTVKWHNEPHIHITVWQDKKPLKREIGKNTQVGTPGSWLKITVSVLTKSALDRLTRNLIKGKPL